VSSAILAGLLSSDTPLVLDADALRLLAMSTLPAKRLSAAPLVLTPHPGEFAGLALRSAGSNLDGSRDKPPALAGTMEATLFDTPAILGKCASYYNAVVVLKNHVTWIAAPDGRLAVWDGQEPALGTGGSGDVLAGLVAGLMARGCSAFEAACAGVIAHGLAGKEAAAALGFFDASVLPSYAARILYRETVHGNKG
jgi:NAD(P)H-hydrate epimerase